MPSFRYIYLFFALSYCFTLSGARTGSEFLWRSPLQGKVPRWHSRLGLISLVSVAARATSTVFRVLYFLVYSYTFLGSRTDSAFLWRSPFRLCIYYFIPTGSQDDLQYLTEQSSLEDLCVGSSIVNEIFYACPSLWKHVYCTNRGRNLKTSFSARLNACVYPYGIPVRLVVYLHVAAARGSCEARI